MDDGGNHQVPIGLLALAVRLDSPSPRRCSCTRRRSAAVIASSATGRRNSTASPAAWSALHATPLPALPVARGVDDYPLASSVAAERDTVREVLQRIDRLATTADQHAEVRRRRSSRAQSPRPRRPDLALERARVSTSSSSSRTRCAGSPVGVRAHRRRPERLRERLRGGVGAARSAACRLPLPPATAGAAPRASVRRRPQRLPPAGGRCTLQDRPHVGRDPVQDQPGGEVDDEGHEHQGKRTISRRWFLSALTDITRLATAASRRRPRSAPPAPVRWRCRSGRG